MKTEPETPVGRRLSDGAAPPKERRLYRNMIYIATLRRGGVRCARSLGRDIWGRYAGRTRGDGGWSKGWKRRQSGWRRLSMLAGERRPVVRVDAGTSQH